MKLARPSAPAIEAFRDDLLKKGAHVIPKRRLEQKQCSRALARKLLVTLKSIISEAQRRGLVPRSKLDLRPDAERVVDLDPEVANGALQLRVAE